MARSLAEMTDLVHPTLTLLATDDGPQFATTFPTPNMRSVVWNAGESDAISIFPDEETMHDELDVERTATPDEIEGFRAFVMHRDKDSKGRSGTGVPAVGVQYPNGRCAMGWLTEPNSVALYDSIDELRDLHGHGGRTRIKFVGGDD